MAVPPLKSIQCFVATAKHLSFSLAANELCVTQSAVSHQVKQLEDHLGKKLINRQGKKIQLTQAGDDFYRVCGDALERISSVSLHVKEAQGVQLNVLAQTSVAVDWLTSKITDFYEQHPKINLRLTMESSADSFNPEDYDIIIGTWPTPDNFVTQSLRQEYWYPVCSPALAEHIDIDDCQSLLAYPLYTSENGADWQFWGQRMQIIMPPKLKHQHFGLAILATKAALNSKGIALSNQFLSERHIERGELVHFPQWQYVLPWGQYQLHYKKSSHADREVRAFNQWFCRLVQQ